MSTDVFKLFPFKRNTNQGIEQIEMIVPVGGEKTILAKMIMVMPGLNKSDCSDGFWYEGLSDVDLDMFNYQQVGLNLNEAKALKYVSTSIRKFDAINSCGPGLFSYGFCQFVGGDGREDLLNNLLSVMKLNCLDGFTDVFINVGIDVADNDQITVEDSNGLKYHGISAWIHIKNCLPLYGAFIQAGFNNRLAKCQLRFANARILQPAINGYLQIILGENSLVTSIRVRKVISSEAGLAIVFLMVIDYGKEMMLRLLSEGISRIGRNNSCQTADDLMQLDERLIFEYFLNTNNDSKLVQLLQSIFRSDLNFIKMANLFRIL